MQTVSSARRTCIASASAVECTATVLMPISWQARWIRSAISPRLAIRSFLIAICLAEDHERLVELHRLAVATLIFLTVPALGAVIGFITFIASMISRVSPAFTAWPTVMNGFAPGSGDRKAVPTIGDFTGFAAELLFLRR